VKEQRDITSVIALFLALLALAFSIAMEILDAHYERRRDVDLRERVERLEQLNNR